MGPAFRWGAAWCVHARSMQAAGLSLACCEGCARPPRLAGHECSATSEGDVSVWRALCSCISFRVSFWTAHMWGWSTICCGGAAASLACPCAVARVCVNTFVAVAVCVLRQSNLPAGGLLAFGGPSTVSQAGAAEPNLWLSHLADRLLFPRICSVCEAVCISKAALSFARVAAACAGGLLLQWPATHRHVPHVPAATPCPATPVLGKWVCCMRALGDPLQSSPQLSWPALLGVCRTPLV